MFIQRPQVVLFEQPYSLTCIEYIVSYLAVEKNCCKGEKLD